MTVRELIEDLTEFDVAGADGRSPEVVLDPVGGRYYPLIGIKREPAPSDYAGAIVIVGTRD